MGSPHQPRLTRFEARRETQSNKQFDVNDSASTHLTGLGIVVEVFVSQRRGVVILPNSILLSQPTKHSAHDDQFSEVTAWMAELKF